VRCGAHALVQGRIAELRGIVDRVSGLVVPLTAVPGAATPAEVKGCRAHRHRLHAVDGGRVHRLFAAPSHHLASVMQWIQSRVKPWINMSLT